MGSRPDVVPSAQARRLAALRRVSRLLDSALEIPGTGYRIGVDPVLGLVPGLGDLVSPLFTIAILWEARALGVPRIVQVRMLVNVAVDALLGAIPIAGDLFDVAWKANARNLALLERHAGPARPAGPGDWAFVLAIAGLMLAVAAAPVVLALWLIWPAT